jgi:hypothetical protein
MTKATHKTSMGTAREEQITWNQANTTPQSFIQSFSWTNVADGMTNPLWRTAIAKSENATTVFTAQKTTVEHTDGVLWVDGYVNNSDTPANRRTAYKAGWLDFSDSRGALATSSTDDAALSMAASKFYSKANNIIKALEGGELIGELGKTAQSIIRLGSALTGTIFNWKRKLKRISARNWRQASGAAADAYLEWKFGWDPLAQDVHTLASGLVEDYKDVIPLSATGRSSKQMSATQVQANSQGLGTYDTCITDVMAQTVRFVGAIRVDRQGVGGLAERLGLSPRNFLSTAYNLLPWTYMIDYFTNLGDIIGAIGFPTGKIAWCCMTTRTSRSVTYASGSDFQILSGIKCYPGYPIIIPSKTVWTNRTIVRAPALPPVIPSFRFKIPSVLEEAGRMKWLNIAAVLAAQTFGSKYASSHGWK